MIVREDISMKFLHTRLFLVRLPVNSIWTEKYLDFKRDFQNIFNIYFSYTYEPYLLHNQLNNFS